MESLKKELENNLLKSMLAANSFASNITDYQKVQEKNRICVLTSELNDIGRAIYYKGKEDAYKEILEVLGIREENEDA